MEGSQARRIETVRDLIRGCLETFNASLLTRSVEPLPVGFRAKFVDSNRGEFNAYAAQYRPGTPPQYGVTRSAMFGILDLCMEVASAPGFLPEVEGSNELLDNMIPRDVVRFRSYPTRDLDMLAIDLLGHVPRSPARQNIGWYLFPFAARFVSMHEQGHYLGGHVRLAKSGELFEAAESTQKATALTPEERRAFELEADSFALRNSALLGAYRWDEFQQSSELDDFVPTRPDWCMLSFLGAALVGLLLSEIHTGSSERSLHPTPLCRLLGLMRDVEYIRARVSETAAPNENLDAQWEAAISRAFLALQTASNALSPSTAQGLHGLIKAHVESKDHPAKDEYRALVEVLLVNEERLDRVRAEVAVEIGGPIV